MKYVPFQLIRSCPFCESTRVRRSERRGVFERLVLRLLLLRPFRCETCTRRHYNFFFARRAGVPEPPPSQ